MINTPLIENDPFTKKLSVKWKKIAGNKWYEEIMNGSVNMVSQNPDINRLFLTVNYFDNKDILILRHPKKDYLLDVDDKFYILFENEEVLQFDIEKKSHHLYDSLGDIYKQVCENRIQLYKEDLLQLKSNKIRDWRILTSGNRTFDGMKPFGGNVHCDYDSLSDLQNVLQSLFNDYYDTVSSLNNWNPLNKGEINSNSTLDGETCHLYLMKDLSNGYYKIGISNKPKYREKTLQSEKPTIELLKSKEFPNRKIASAFEMSIHKSYDNKRLRGEWFELNENDLEEIEFLLK